MKSKTIIHFIYLLLVAVLIFMYSTKKPMVFIGKTLENEQLIHVAFLFPITNYDNDTLFVITTNDSILTCKTIDGTDLYMIRYCH